MYFKPGPSMEVNAEVAYINVAAGGGDGGVALRISSNVYGNL